MFLKKLLLIASISQYWALFTYLRLPDSDFDIAFVTSATTTLTFYEIFFWYNCDFSPCFRAGCWQSRSTLITFHLRKLQSCMTLQVCFCKLFIKKQALEALKIAEIFVCYCFCCCVLFAWNPKNTYRLC